MDEPLAGDAGDGHQDRLLAARGLSAVLQQGQTLDQLEAHQPLTPFGTELLYGSCRYYFSLAASLEPLLQRPLRNKDREVWAMLIVGAYQLTRLRVPEHAAIAATVAASKRLRQPWAASVVNACLRALQRLGPKLRPAAEDLPDALGQALRQAYPSKFDALAEALLERAPMTLRVNTRRLSVERYSAKLATADIKHRRGNAPETLVLNSPISSTSLPGYGAGEVSIQDAGAQEAARLCSTLLPDCASPRVLDACAAPGGKLFHLLEHLHTAGKNAQVTALEKSPARLGYLKSEAARLGHTDSAKLVLGDAMDRQWWDGTSFDLILLDAPCTGTGTLRRHPEIKLRRDFKDLGADIATQNALLANLLPLLRPGGNLLYATCSLLPAENDARIARALKTVPALQSRPLALTSGVATKYGWQLLPTDPDTDGFYYAVLVKLK